MHAAATIFERGNFCGANKIDVAAYIAICTSWNDSC